MAESGFGHDRMARHPRTIDHQAVDHLLLLSVGGVLVEERRIIVTLTLPSNLQSLSCHGVLHQSKPQVCLHKPDREPTLELQPDTFHLLITPTH